MVESRHTLVVRPDNNGDVLLAGPAIRAVANGSTRVTLWVGPRGRAAGHLLPEVDQVVCRELPWIDPEPDPVDRAWLDDTIDMVASLDADAAVIFGSFHQTPLPTALVARAAGIGFVAATSVDHPGSLLDVRHRIDDDVHEVERAVDLARAAGFDLPDGDDGRLRIRPGDEANPVPVGPPYVVVHPGASVPARQWAPDRMGATVTALEDRGWRVVVTGGPDETALTRRVAGDRAIDLGGATSWPVLAEVLAGAAAVVTGNTGPAHLAAAVSTPVVDVFAPVVPAVRWRPWMVDHVVLGDQAIECAGCRARRCPRDGHPCLDSVTVDAVLDAVATLTGGHPNPRPRRATMPILASRRMASS